VEKVTVTKEVSEAIEHIRHNCCIGSLGNYLDGEWASPHPKTRLAINELDKDSLLHAIFYGYEIEKTPEEKVRDYHNELLCREAYLENSGCDGSQHRQGWLSVVETLNILGIKIEGVND
jgi:hypothetical protein